MSLKWPFTRQNRHQPAILSAIFIAPAAAVPMISVDTVEALADKGLQGDRYSVAGGYWKSIEACEVTLITEDDLKRAKKGQSAEFQHRLDNGCHRRNLLLAGIKTSQLEGKHFSIGTAVFSYHKARPPCGYLDKIEGTGLCRALAKNSGVCIHVVSSGRLSLGDELKILADMR